MYLLLIGAYEMNIFNKYYSLKKIMSKNADYNIIIGERSNGKTYSCLKYALEKYVKEGKQFAYIRRWREDVVGARASNIFNAINNDRVVEKLTKGKFTKVVYNSGKFYLSFYDDDLKKWICENVPCGYTFSLTAMEHDKSTSYPLIDTIIFDEFLTRKYYLPNEFVEFMNVISTIVRHRDNVKIFMLGNTVNKYCPYFDEMGLNKIQNMKQDTIDLYLYGDSDLRVAVEYCGTSLIKKDSDKYFAFNNPKLKMITGGLWEIDIYPHLPFKYSDRDIQFTYFIMFNGETLQCEVISTGRELFTYIHRKTTPIKNADTDLVYTLEHSEKINIVNNIAKPFNKVTRMLWDMFVLNKIFYQDNTVGEIVRNYLIECKKS